jgi:hypothetical protein
MDMATVVGALAFPVPLLLALWLGLWMDSRNWAIAGGGIGVAVIALMFWFLVRSDKEKPKEDHVTD